MISKVMCFLRKKKGFSKLQRRFQDSNLRRVKNVYFIQIMLKHLAARSILLQNSQISSWDYTNWKYLSLKVWFKEHLGRIIDQSNTENNSPFSTFCFFILKSKHTSLWPCPSLVLPSWNAWLISQGNVFATYYWFYSSKNGSGQ